MASGWYEPIPNEPPEEDRGRDNDGADDDDEEEVNRTQTFQPPASSTPKPRGEAYEMSDMGKETSGIGVTVPPAPKYDEFVNKETLVARLKAFIKAKAPKVDFSRIVVGLGKKPINQRKAVAFGPKGGETIIFKQDGTFTAAFSRQYSDALGPSAEEVIAKDRVTLRETQQRLTDAQQQEARLNKEAAKQQQATQERQQLENQFEQINQRIDNMVNEGGTEIERKTETDRLKRASAKLRRDIEAAKATEKKYAQSVKERNKAAREVARMKRQYDAQKQKKDTTEAALNRTKPLDELNKDIEELKHKMEVDREIMNNKNASSRERMAAGGRFSENTDELARLEPQVQEREEALPLRERVKNIFKKYGWTLQAVALGVGIVLSALALAGMNGLKAGTKAVGQGLKAISQKLGSLLPGLIGSIVSFIFKAAGQVFSFLGEHTWLLILAVVVFFMERLLKRQRR